MATTETQGESNSPASTPKKSVFHVAGPGSITFKGETCKAGETLRLTPDEAASFGFLLRPGRPPKPPTYDKRKAGKYLIVGPGSLFRGGKPRYSGETVDLTEAEARHLGSLVKEA